MNEPVKCLCTEPTCSKCLLGNCREENCPVHTSELKARRHSAGKWYVVPQTEGQIEENRRKIEELRKQGLLAQHEKTFKLHEDGTVEQI